MRAARNRPEIRKKSGMRNGRAHSMKVCSDVVVPMAYSTPRVDCIRTTRMMQMPLATSTQASRPVASFGDILLHHDELSKPSQREQPQGEQDAFQLTLLGGRTG